MTVKAGYARNYLVPKKKALYATPENFERLGVTDPEAETIEEKRARLAAEAAAEEDEEAAADLRAADLLKHYLRNKVVSLLHAKRALTRLSLSLLAKQFCSCFAPFVSNTSILFPLFFFHNMFCFFLNKMPWNWTLPCNSIAYDQTQCRSLDGRRPSWSGQRTECPREAIEAFAN